MKLYEFTFLVSRAVVVAAETEESARAALPNGEGFTHEGDFREVCDLDLVDVRPFDATHDEYDAHIVVWNDMPEYIEG